MNTPNIPSPADLYLHRHAFDEIKKAALYASNHLGAMSSPLLVPAEWKPIHDRANSALQILRGVLNDLRESQIQYQRDLPSLSPELAMSLKALDEKLVVHERAAHQWVLSNRRGARTASKVGDWIYLNESIWMSFQFQSELDPVSAESTELCLDWRFASLEFRPCRGENEGVEISSPFFQFGQWTDDHFPVDRPEVTGLRSELLRAFLPHVPELAFVTTHVSSCTLRLEKGTEWQASLLPVNFLA